MRVCLEWQRSLRPEVIHSSTWWVKAAFTFKRAGQVWGGPPRRASKASKAIKAWRPGQALVHGALPLCLSSSSCCCWWTMTCSYPPTAGHPQVSTDQTYKDGLVVLLCSLHFALLVSCYISSSVTSVHVVTHFLQTTGAPAKSIPTTIQFSLGLCWLLAGGAQPVLHPVLLVQVKVC